MAVLYCLGGVITIILEVICLDAILFRGEMIAGIKYFTKHNNHD